MNVTADRPAPGLVVHQPARGFRYGAEAYWLVGLALEAGVPGRALDLGTGSGILAWLLARHGVDVLGVDAWEGWEACWALTQAASRARGRVELVVKDARSVEAERFDVVVCNPPFFRRGEGPLPSEPSKVVARFEGEAGLAELVGAALRASAPDGRVLFVVPRAREAEVGVAGGGQVARVVRIGRGRSVVVLTPGGAARSPRIDVVTDRGPEVAAWYARALEITP